MNVFDEMGIYWSEIADQNQTEAQIQFIKNTVKPDGLVLDLACGTGRHSIPLGKEGYSILCLDVSLNLLKIAKSRSGGIQVVRGDMRCLPFKPEVFSAVVSMDTSFGYLPSEEEDLRSLNQVRKVLGEKGFLVVDVFNREHLINRVKAIGQPKWREFPSFFLLQKRTVTAGGGFLCDVWTTWDKADGQVRVFEHLARLYALSQLQALFEKAGFKIKAVYRDYDRQSFSPNSNRLILVAAAK